MGYPMSYRRVVSRNALHGGYDHSANPGEPGKEAIAGDLRRLEADQRDDWHLSLYAKRTGLTPEQCRAVLDLFFDGVENAPPLPVASPLPDDGLSAALEAYEREWLDATPPAGHPLVHGIFQRLPDRLAPLLASAPPVAGDGLRELEARFADLTNTTPYGDVYASVAGDYLARLAADLLAALRAALDTPAPSLDCRCYPNANGSHHRTCPAYESANDGLRAALTTALEEGMVWEGSWDSAEPNIPATVDAILPALRAALATRAPSLHPGRVYRMGKWEPATPDTATPDDREGA